MLSDVTVVSTDISRSIDVPIVESPTGTILIRLKVDDEVVSVAIIFLNIK